MLLFNVVLFIIVFIIIYALTEISSECYNIHNQSTKSTMQKLKQNLLCDYDRTLRPVVSEDSAVNVEVSITVNYFDFSDRTSQLTVNMWINLDWDDEHLNWNPNDYDNITEIIVKSSEIWYPDLILYNSAKTGGSNLLPETVCTVKKSGRVWCVPICIHTAHCDMDLKRWPYDTQTCSMEYGSWFYDDFQINYSIPSDPYKMAVTNNSQSWDLYDIDATEYYVENNTILKFDFLIARHSGSQIATVIIPAFVLILLILITMSLKPSSIERFYLFGISLLLHFSFLNYLSWMIPANGVTIPFVLSFYKDSLFLTIFGLFVTCIVRNLMSSTSTPPSYVSAFASTVMKNVPVQTILLRDIIPKVTNANFNNEENMDLVSTTPTVQYSKEWFVFAQCIDKITFICYIVTYLIMMLALLPIY